MKKLLGIIALLTLVTSCSNKDTALLKFIGNSQPVLIETDWAGTGYLSGDTVMLFGIAGDYEFFFQPNFSELMSDTTIGEIEYRVAVIEKIYY